MKLECDDHSKLSVTQKTYGIFIFNTPSLISWGLKLIKFLKICFSDNFFLIQNLVIKKEDSMKQTTNKVKMIEKADNLIQLKWYVKMKKKKIDYDEEQQNLIRICDFMIPSDISYIKQSLSIRDYKHSFLGCVIYLKRISNIVYDTDTRIYKYNLEERWPKKCEWKDLENSKLLENILSESKLPKSFLLISSINGYFNFLCKIESAFNLFDTADISLANINKDHYQKFNITEFRLDKKGFNFMNDVPFIGMKYRWRNEGVTESLVSLTHNRLFSELVGLKPKHNEEREGYAIFDCLKIYDWVEFWTIWISLMTNN